MRVTSTIGAPKTPTLKTNRFLHALSDAQLLLELLDAHGELLNLKKNNRWWASGWQLELSEVYLIVVGIILCVVLLLFARQPTYIVQLIRQRVDRVVLRV